MRDGLAQRCAAEFVGTFGIVFAPVALAGASASSGRDSGPLAAAWVSGLAVLAMVYAVGHISAAHLNPAVSIGFAVAGRFPRAWVLPYSLAQISGGIAAAAVCGGLYGPGHGAHVPAVRWPAAIGTETALTFLLMFVIMSVATDRRVNGAVPGIAIGSTVVLDVLIGGPLTGGSMNPARSIGPALFAGEPALAACWIFVVGPVLGALAGARLYELIRGDPRHAQSFHADPAIARSSAALSGPPAPP